MKLKSDFDINCSLSIDRVILVVYSSLIDEHFDVYAMAKCSCYTQWIFVQ